MVSVQKNHQRQRNEEESSSSFYLETSEEAQYDSTPEISFLNQNTCSSDIYSQFDTDESIESNEDLSFNEKLRNVTQ